MKLVLIEWLDSSSCRGGWQPLDELKENSGAVRCRSVGWLLSESGGSKVLVPHISGDEKDGVRPFGKGDIAIPEKAILRMKVLARAG